MILDRCLLLSHNAHWVDTRQLQAAKLQLGVAANFPSVTLTLRSPMIFRRDPIAIQRMQFCNKTALSLRPAKCFKVCLQRRVSTERPSLHLRSSIQPRRLSVDPLPTDLWPTTTSQSPIIMIRFYHFDLLILDLLAMCKLISSILGDARLGSLGLDSKVQSIVTGVQSERLAVSSSYRHAVSFELPLSCSIWDSQIKHLEFGAHLELIRVACRSRLLDQYLKPCAILVLLVGIPQKIPFETTKLF